MPLAFGANLEIPACGSFDEEVAVGIAPRAEMAQLLPLADLDRGILYFDARRIAHGADQGDAGFELHRDGLRLPGLQLDRLAPR